MGTKMQCVCCVCMSAVCVCVCVYMCVVEGKTSKYTDLQSLQVSGLLNPFTAVEATWHSAFGRQFSVLKKKKRSIIHIKF